MFVEGFAVRVLDDSYKCTNAMSVEERIFTLSLFPYSFTMTQKIDSRK